MAPIIPGMVYRTSAGQIMLHPILKSWFRWDAPGAWRSVHQPPRHECTAATQEADWQDGRYAQPSAQR